MRTGIKVGDAMTTKPISTSKDTNIQECARLMKKFDVGSILVQEEKEVIGIVTEYDISRKVVADAKDIEDPVSTIMEKIMVTVEPTADLFDAMQFMRDNEIRHLPVVDNGIFQGLVTMKDILKIEPQLFELVVEKIRLREEARKPIGEVSSEEGICESCGNYSENLFDTEGSKVCRECR